MIQTLLFTILSTTCFAHGNAAPTDSFGFISGFKHPIMGLDHLLAMACVGMISSRIGGKAVWQVPACFVSVMALGCVVGFYGGDFSMMEPIISLSVAIFGILFLMPRYLTLTATFVTVAIFAIVHGYAHGKEMPIFVLPEIYIAGFLTATTVIHVFGVCIGELINKLPQSTRLTQVTGAALMVTGVLLLIGAI